MAAYKPKHSLKPSRKQGVWRSIRDKFLRPVKKKSNGVGKSKVSSTARNEQQMRNVSRVFLLFLLVCLFAASSGWGIYRLLVTTDIFRLTEVAVSGNRMTRERKIVEITGLRQGVNLLRFDTQAAELRAKELAWVDRVDIKVAWPTRVMVRVWEHQPLALVNLAGDEGSHLCYIDGAGEVFTRVRPGQDIDFPVITGVLTQEGLEDGRIADGTLSSQALNFLRLAARGNAILPVQAVSEVHVDPALGLVVYLVDQPFPIYMGTERIRTKYYRLVKILERLYRKRQIEGIKEIRMDYTENKVLVATNCPGG